MNPYRAVFFSSLCLACTLLSACVHAPLVEDGGKGTRVTNPRVAPWAFFRGDNPLLVGERLEAGDVLETQCAHDACAADHRFLTVWNVVDGRAVRTTEGSERTHPDRERRVVLAPGAEYVVLTWTRTPIDTLPRLDLLDGTRKAPHSQSMLVDDTGQVIGVIQWGAVDRVK